jgi:plasmid stabilization system protein ParE
MSYKVIYHTDAEQDIRNAKKYYKEKLNCLEKRFALAVKETLVYIADNPYLFEVKYKNTRVAFTKVFSFGIHYIFDENTKNIQILAVLHTSKNIR